MDRSKSFTRSRAGLMHKDLPNAYKTMKDTVVDGRASAAGKSQQNQHQTIKPQSSEPEQQMKSHTVLDGAVKKTLQQREMSYSALA